MREVLGRVTCKLVALATIPVTIALWPVPETMKLSAPAVPLTMTASAAASPVLGAVPRSMFTVLTAVPVRSWTVVETAAWK